MGEWRELKKLRFDDRCVLQIGVGSIKGQEINELSQILSKNLALNDLSLNFYNSKEIDDKGLETLSESISKLSSSVLVNLQLNFWGCSKLTHTGLKKLSESISKFSPPVLDSL